MRGRGHMLAGLAAVLSMALLAAGCAGPLGPSMRAGRGPQVATVAAPALSPRPDLDNLMYAGGGAASAVAAAPIAALAPAALPDAASAYSLDSGDRLRVVVFGQDGLSNTYVVDAAGNITMPLIGAVPARGSSTSELAGKVGARLRDGFIREPHVAIEIESYRPFFILGEVTYPGQYPFVPNMTVETAVAIAGGFTPRAYRWDVKVARNRGGQAYRLSVPLTYALRPGDTVTIEERWF
ncbi:MAG TPA: polysaccharide biosynthesis/export family protein [Xanthobacteraceae bacterium]|jgi:polysaccharide export outer membrane protein|nr:polysaccharide biosynthesis/export family protein [Xanthobacteraceae bacterium]